MGRSKRVTRIPIEEMQVNELIVKLEKQDSDRLIISRAFAGLFEEEQDKNPNALKDFKSNFQKIESLISLRNRFARGCPNFCVNGVKGHC